MPALFSIPRAQLRGNSIVIYYEPVYEFQRKKNGPTFAEQLKALHRLHLSKMIQEKETYSGHLTAGARKRMQRAISLFIQASPEREIYNNVTHRKQKFKLSYITLTIPLRHRNISLKEGYAFLLKPFLDWMRKTEGVTTYIWKAEVQKRKQLHYHITTNVWIHHADIRKKWNYLLSKGNYMEEFIAEYGHTNPPSTDVAKVYKIHDIQSYLTKEFCKSIQNNHESNGKIWNCSENLKGVKYFTIDFKEFHEKKVLLCHRKINLTEVQTEQCTILKARNNWSSLILTPNELSSYNSFLKKIRRELPDLFN